MKKASSNKSKKTCKRQLSSLNDREADRNVGVAMRQPKNGESHGNATWRAVQ